MKKRTLRRENDALKASALVDAADLDEVCAQLHFLELENADLRQLLGAALLQMKDAGITSFKLPPRVLPDLDAEPDAELQGEVFQQAAANFHATVMQAKLVPDRDAG